MWRRGRGGMAGGRKRRRRGRLWHSNRQGLMKGEFPKWEGRERKKNRERERERDQ
jgi:hypothetical protein